MMNRKLPRKLAVAFLVTIGVYLLCGIIIYLMQEKILFHPKPLPAKHPFTFDQPFREINVPWGKDNLSIIQFKPEDEPKGIVLFYHGNMENAEHYRKYPPFFLKHDYEVWMIDYPGFGKTTGRRSEKIMYAQALKMYEVASKEKKTDNIVIYGKSIGTGVASYVAANRPCRQLTLETPYYSISSLAREYFPIYPVNWMVRYSFPNHYFLQKVKAAVTLVHGTKDEVVPYGHSVKLKKENMKINLLTIENGKHNNLSEFDAFRSGLDSLLRL